MIKKIIPFIFLVIVACKKESNDFQFDYKITRYFYINNLFADSLIYYYNDDNKLLKVDRFYYRTVNSEYYVDYKDNYIENWNGNYIFDSMSRINSIEHFGFIIEFKYNSDKKIYEKYTVNNYTSQEKFYEYQNDNIIKDSTVIYNDNSDTMITVYLYEYTDTLVKDFMVDYSGLFEIPKSSKNLLKQAKSIEHGILCKYSYNISENKLIQYSQNYDLFNNKKGETMMTVFQFNEK